MTFSRKLTARLEEVRVVWVFRVQRVVQRLSMVYSSSKQCSKAHDEPIASNRAREMEDGTCSCPTVSGGSTEKPQPQHPFNQLFTTSCHLHIVLESHSHKPIQAVVTTSCHLHMRARRRCPQTELCQPISIELVSLHICTHICGFCVCRSWMYIATYMWLLCVQILDEPMPEDCHAEQHADYGGDAVMW